MKLEVSTIVPSPCSLSTYHSMASLLGILLEFWCRLRPAKGHIKRFLRRWASLLALLVRKISKWRFLCSSKLGMTRNPKPAELSFPSDIAGSSSASGGSVCSGRIGGYVVAASAVPASANQPLGRECADPQSNPTPLTPTLATFPVHPHLPLDPSPANETVGTSHANHSSGSLSIESDRLSVIHQSSPAPVQIDRPSRDPRASYHQFGPGPGASRERCRSSRSPSPKPSPSNMAQPPNLDMAPIGTDTDAYADRVIHHTIGLQGLADLPSSSF